MLTQASLVILLSTLAFPQNSLPVIHSYTLDELRAVRCQGELPEGYSCAIIVDLGLPRASMIVSVVGGEIRQGSVGIGGTIYTAVLDPPLERFHLRRTARIPARVAGDVLVLRCPDGIEAKGKIVRHENIHPNQPQPA
jgi:hypothetical protein